MKVTRDVFGNMINLQQLDISHNRILEFEQDTFKHTRKLQVSDYGVINVLFE